MATEVSERPGITGDWKIKVIVGIFLFVVGVVGLGGLLPIGWTESFQWLSSTALVLTGLTIMMYGLANVT